MSGAAFLPRMSRPKGRCRSLRQISHA